MVEGVLVRAEGLSDRLAFAVFAVLPLALLARMRRRPAAADRGADLLDADFDLAMVLEADFFSGSVDGFLLGMDISSR
jgi:hypothetical protein